MTWRRYSRTSGRSGVVRPGGHVVCLDTSPPPPTPLRPLVRLYLRQVIPLLGRLIAGERPAYAYLSASTEGFTTPEELAAIMRDAGLVGVTYRRFMAGTIAVHVGTRPQRGTTLHRQERADRSARPGRMACENPGNEAY
jgi:hypothetical protein